MISTRLDFFLMKLSQYRFDPTWNNSRKIQFYKLQMELRFLKMFFWFYENWHYEGNNNMDSDSIMSEFEVMLPEVAVDWDYEGNNNMDSDSIMSEFEVMLPEVAVDWGFANQLMEIVEHFKPRFKQICFDLLNCSLLYPKSFTSDDFDDFIDTILQNLEDLLCLESQMIVPVKDQVEVLQQKLKLFWNLVDFAAEISFYDGQNVQVRVSKSRNNIFGKFISFRNVCPFFYFNTLNPNPSYPELSNFRVQVQGWTIKVASLSFLYWVDNLEGETISKLNTIYLDVLQQIKPRSPEAIRMFLGLMKEALVSIRSNTLLMGKVVANYVDMLLEDLIASMEDSFRMALHDGLITLITFLIDPPEQCGRIRNEICAKADALVDKAASLISSPSSFQEKYCIPNGRHFLKKIDTLKREIKENYVQFREFSWSEFPKTNGLGFLDFLLENLKEKSSSLPFAKYLLLAMQQKLISIRPCLKDILEQQIEFEETNPWLRILQVAYAVEHFVDSCFFEGNQIWHMMICLRSFLEEIEFLITAVEKIRGKSLYKNYRGPNVEMNPTQIIPKYVKTSRFEGAVVGFKNEAEAILNQLLRGSTELKIVSIVGMAGQGKTTLAYKVYNDPLIRNHFHLLVWCSVSQEYQLKRLLQDILSDVTALNHDQIQKMSEGELAEKLYRCLKGQKYLIVLDDIWDIKAWNELKASIPTDSNGSRIMITSRIHTMSSRTNLCSSTHVLCPLSAEESWELLKKKLFDENGCPENLSAVGFQIVNLCEGLPLSIVVIAGVLARKIRDLTWWKEIARNLSSKILGEEGCMNILELSYTHLPAHLKPCFLYFGAFQQGKVVKVQKLIRLWVAEGFIPKIGTKKLEDVAEDFLTDLIVRSLVTVVERTSNSGIKKCRIHDLLFELCQAKIKQERFLCPLNDPQCPSNIIDGQYRLSIHTELETFFKSNQRSLHIRTLLFPHLGTWFRGNGSSFFMSFKFLSVLDLGYGAFFFTFPAEINSLIHLRYLALRGNFFEPKIHSLLNLEVLCLYTPSAMIILPLAIWKMKRLRHIQMPSATYFSFGNSVLEVEGDTLDNVDTLSWPMLCRNEYSEELLRRFPKIRKLRFQLYDYHRRYPQFPVLDFLKNIESLNVLCLKGMDFSCGFQLSSTLKKLTLSGSRLPWSKISAIAKLPNLEVLKLLDAFEGLTWDMGEEGGFMKLRFLKLKGLNIRQWKAFSDHFPNLECLVLERCYDLQEIPSEFGEISTLDLIDVRYCTREAESSAREILEVQRGLGNDGFVVLITSRNSRIYEDNKHRREIISDMLHTSEIISDMLRRFVFKSN